MVPGGGDAALREELAAMTQRCRDLEATVRSAEGSGEESSARAQAADREKTEAARYNNTLIYF